MRKRFSKACICDLDGTILPHDSQISKRNYSTLEALGERGICRVLATGRSLYSLKKVLKPDAPFDYVIFATGAGVMDWQGQRLLDARNLDREQIIKVWQVLEGYELDYMLHEPVPHTHIMYYRRAKGTKDFHQRQRIYREFAWELDDEMIGQMEEATQFLAILEREEEALYEEIREKLRPLNTVKTTSPIDFQSFWVEIFAPQVSKGHSVLRLLEMLGIKAQEAMAIGNDYNDLQMLQMLPKAFVTANAPKDLKESFEVVADCREDGFSEAVERVFGGL